MGILPNHPNHEKPWLCIGIRTRGFRDPPFEETSTWGSFCRCFMRLKYLVNCWVYVDEIATYVYYHSYLVQSLCGGFLKWGYPVLDHHDTIISIHNSHSLLHVKTIVKSPMKYGICLLCLKTDKVRCFDILYLQIKKQCILLYYVYNPIFTIRIVKL